MKFRHLLSLSFALAVLGGASLHAEESVRFSKSLAPEEHASLGLSRLSSDQVAVLDALVRRDIEQSQFTSKEPRAARFSARLSADERNNAGLVHLEESEVARLDERVERLVTPPSSGISFATANGKYSVPSVKLRRDPSIHGHITLGVAVGSDGYSAYGGGVVLDYIDPANKFGISIGYSEVRSKGGALYRGGYGGYGSYGPYGGRYHGRPFGPMDGFW